MASLRRSTKKVRVLCHGGPWDGRYIQLADPKTGTLAFSLNGFTGRYTEHLGDLQWQSSKPTVHFGGLPVV